MKNFNFLILVLILNSCNGVQNENTHLTFHPEKSIEKLIEGYFNYHLEGSKMSDGFELNYRMQKFKDDGIKSLKVVDKIAIPKTNLTAVFYSYNLGSDVIREVEFVSKVDNLYLISDKYYSSYTNDPFGNGDTKAAKILMEKIDRWESDPEELSYSSSAAQEASDAVQAVIDEVEEAVNY